MSGSREAFIELDEELVGEQEMCGSWRVGRGAGGGRVPRPRHEVGRGVHGSPGGRRHCPRRQLLLHRTLLYVVTELCWRHAVGPFAICLELSAAELGLREGRRGEGEGLCAEWWCWREGGWRGWRGRRRGLYRPEALRFGVERTGHLKQKTNTY